MRLPFLGSGAAALIALVLLCGVSAHADEDSTADEGPDSGVAVAAIASPQAAPCFPIARIVVDGAVDELRFAQHTLDAQVGHCIGVAAINTFAQTLTAALLERGFVTTRVRIPEQDLSTGTLRFEVTPGTIRAIAFDSAVHDTTWKNAFPTRPGRLLNLRDLEQGLEQMKRVPSQDVQMKIAPGTRPGQSDIALSLRETKRWKIAFDVNDGGSAATGALQGSASIAFDNPLHLNDIVSLSLNQNVEGGVQGGTRGNTLDYSVPFGYWTLGLEESNFNFSQKIAGRTTPFTLSGMTHHGAVSLERMMYRTQRIKTSVTMRVAQNSSRNFVDDTEIDVQTRNSSYGEIVLKREANDGRNRFNASLGFRAGLALFGALPDIIGPASPPTAYYTLGTADVSAVIPFRSGKTNLRWEPHVRAQVTNDHLYLSDAFSIGNRYTVRGFDGSAAIAAESGYFVRNDLIIPTASPNRSLYLGIDTGRVWGPSTAGLSGQSLTGIAVGMRGGSARATFDAALGFGIGAPAGLRTAQPATTLDFTYHL